MNKSDEFDPARWSSPYPIIGQAILWLLVIALSLETILGNAMVVLAYRLDRAISKQVSNRYIVSLAISDMIIGVEGFPLFTIYVLNGERWPLGQIACETWLYLDYTLCLVSILTVLLITVDRYLSVCHTAAYIKWQSPGKIQVMIIGSWILPALVFAVVIYGWASFGGDASSMSGGDCSVPFLTNPYVNMGMYVAYYWSTLIAMLILYKGIHKAAKKLEKKAKAKERRHIALILTQRLGTQVGVSLMLRTVAGAAAVPITEEAPQEAATAGTKDSGYQTTAALSTTLCTVSAISDASQKIVAGGDTLPPAKSASADQILDREPLRISGKVRRRASDRETRKRVDSNKPPTLERDEAVDSLSLLFDDASFSSIFHFQLPPMDSFDVCSETTSSILMRHSTMRKQMMDGVDTTLTTPNGLDCEKLLIASPESEIRDVLPTFENFCPGQSPPVAEQRGAWRRMAAGLVHAMRGRLLSATSRRSVRSRTSSTSSGNSSIDAMPTPGPPIRKEGHVAMTEGKMVCMQSEDLGLASPPATTGRLDPLSVNRKISTMTSTTRERIVSSVFSPLAALRESRRQTRAERRAHKAFRTITFIVGLFALLWSPYYVLATIYGFCSGQCIPGWLYTLSYYMCYLNSSGNPFAYAMANRQFRVAFVRILRGNFRRLP